MAIINRVYAGVRLSYCLDEWAGLAKVYPPAMDALVEQKNVALNSFNKTESISNFKDYTTICEYLKCSKEAVTLFKGVHDTNRDLSKKMFRSVYEPLVQNKEWYICREYLRNGVKKYEELIELFDDVIKLVKEKCCVESKEIEKDLTEKTKEECLWLLNIHFYTNNKYEYIKLSEKMQEDLKNRDYSDLYNEILNDAPKWSE